MMSRYVWLILLLICCLHFVAARSAEKSKDSRYSSGSKEDKSKDSYERSGSKEDSSKESAKDKGKACWDRKRNQDETDADCGGNKCPKCANGKICKVNCDCISSFCKNGRCGQSSTELAVKTTAQTVTRPDRTTTQTITVKPTTTTVTPTTTTVKPTTITVTPTTTTVKPTTTTVTLTTRITTVKPTTTAPTCEFQCKNGGVCVAHNRCKCADGFSGPTCEVQSVGLCLDNETFGTQPILSIAFGNGSTQYSRMTPARFNFSTTYQQRFEPVTNDGMFSFINSVHDDFHGAWHTDAKDHTMDANGYMYLVNADFTPGQFYNGRVDNLCIGLRYEFSVYMANLCKPSGKINPNVLFEVRTVDGNELLAQLNSGDVIEHNTLTWHKYGFSFVAPKSSVKLLMISNAKGGDGNDLVIDDIALRVCAHTGSGFCPSNQ